MGRRKKSHVTGCWFAPVADILKPTPLTLPQLWEQPSRACLGAPLAGFWEGRVLACVSSAVSAPYRTSTSTPPPPSSYHIHHYFPVLSQGLLFMTKGYSAYFLLSPNTTSQSLTQSWGPPESFCWQSKDKITFWFFFFFSPLNLTVLVATLHSVIFYPVFFPCMSNHVLRVIKVTMSLLFPTTIADR